MSDAPVSLDNKQKMLLQMYGNHILDEVVQLLFVDFPEIYKLSDDAVPEALQEDFRKLQKKIIGDCNRSEFFYCKEPNEFFEYYCLCLILKKLGTPQFGFKKSAPSERHLWGGKTGLKGSSRLANIFHLTNDDGISLTLYREPSISGISSQNAIHLYRTNSGGADYTPDFVLRIQHPDRDFAHYIILDAKFARDKYIEQHLDDVVDKYLKGIDADDGKISMIWTLQGNSEEKTFTGEDPSEAAKEVGLQRFGNCFVCVADDSGMVTFWREFEKLLKKL